MDLLQDLQRAIRNDDDSTVDTLLFISKIETLLNGQNSQGRSTLFYKAESMVKDFYSKKYQNPYSKEAILLYGYMGKEVDKEFYNLNEITAEDRELLTDKIIKRMKQIKNSACSFEYKFNSLVLLYMYLQELNPEKRYPEAMVMLGKMLAKKILIRSLFLLLLSFPFWLPSVAQRLFEATKGTPKELIYHGAVQTASIFLVMGTALVYLHLKEFVKREWNIFVLIMFFIISSATLFDYVTDINTDISRFRKETVTLEHISPSLDNKNRKYAVIELADGSKQKLMFHTNLDLETNRKYVVRYNRTGIIVEAEELDVVVEESEK